MTAQPQMEARATLPTRMEPQMAFPTLTRRATAALKTRPERRLAGRSSNHDISAAVREALKEYSPEARVAVLPQGPLTIPYLA